MVSFVLGLMLGTLFGFLLMGMCVAAGNADKMSEEYFRKVMEKQNEVDRCR